MNKTLFSAAAGFFALALSLQAQGTFFSDGLRHGDWQSDVSFASLALGERMLVSHPVALGWLNPGADYLPPFRGVAPRRSRPASDRIAPLEDESGDWLERTRRSRYNFGGEVGFVYGRETGRGGGDFYSGYIVGEIGNENFRLSVGASHSEFNGRGVRRSR